MPIKEKSGHSVIIRANTEVNITLCHQEPGLEEVRTVVGGTIAIVPGIPNFQWNGEPAQMLVNEDGTHWNLPVNRIATQLLRDAYPNKTIIPIVGDVVMLTGAARWK